MSRSNIIIVGAFVIGVMSVALGVAVFVGWPVAMIFIGVVLISLTIVEVHT